MRYTLKLYLPDMGCFTQPGVASLEDALWHVNSARAHDGLDPIDMDTMLSMANPRRLFREGNLTLTPESKRP